jgi:hypothetical protein
MEKKQAEESKVLDCDSILNEAKQIRASLHIAAGGIEHLYEEGDLGYYEMNALLYQVEDVLKRNVEYLDRMAEDLRKGGAKDYEPVSGFTE